MKFGYFSQLQMPKPWSGPDAEVRLYRDAAEAYERARSATAVGFEPMKLPEPAKSPAS